jgi:Tfp pilus assembly protein PilX
MEVRREAMAGPLPEIHAITRVLVTVPRARLAAESGFAVPVVLLSILVAFALGTVTVLASVNSQSSAVRDERAKEALAAAEAGVQHALLRYNRMTARAPNVCVAGSSTMTTQAPAADGWCSPVTGSLAGNPDAAFTYRVCPRGRDQALPCPSPNTAHNIVGGEAASGIEIVSTGTVDGVSRRVEVIARSSGGDRPFAGNAGVIGLDSIRADGNASIYANVATNGAVTLDNNADLYCDAAYVGNGHGIIRRNSSTASCPATTASTSLPPVNQGDVRTNNSNGRWYANGTWFPNDPMTPSCTTTCWSPSAAANTAAYKHLTITSGASRTLTLGGSNYSLCKLTLSSNSNLYVQSGADVRIYFDSPENCPGLPVVDGCYQQLDVSSNARIAATGNAKVALLFVGSDARPTCANFSSNTYAGQSCEQDFVVYGPRTHMRFASNSHFCGSIAGKSVYVDSNSTLKASNANGDFELPSSVAGHYGVEDFVECTATTGTNSTPNTGC